MRASSDHSRRRFLRLAASAGAGGAAALLVTCGGDGGDERDETRTADTGNPDADAAVLNALLDLEHLALNAYLAVGGLLPSGMRDFAGHERAHAGRLADAIAALGGTPNEPKPADEYAALTAGVDDAQAALRFAADLEETAVAAYLDAIPRLSTGRLRRAAGEILATQSEHLAVLRDALGERAAFPFGTREGA